HILTLARSQTNGLAILEKQQPPCAVDSADVEQPPPLGLSSCLLHWPRIALSAMRRRGWTRGCADPALGRKKNHGQLLRRAANRRRDKMNRAETYPILYLLLQFRHELLQRDVEDVDPAIAPQYPLEFGWMILNCPRRDGLILVSARGHS